MNQASCPRCAMDNSNGGGGKIGAVGSKASRLCAYIQNIIGFHPEKHICGCGLPCAPPTLHVLCRQDVYVNEPGQLPALRNGQRQNWSILTTNHQQQPSETSQCNGIGTLELLDKCSPTHPPTNFRRIICLFSLKKINTWGRSAER